MKLKTLLFWIKVAAFVVAMWAVFFLIGFLRGQHLGVSSMVVGTVVMVGIFAFALAIYRADVPLFAPWWSRRWKEHKKQMRSSVGEEEKGASD